MEPGRISAMMGQLWSPIVAVTSRWQGRSNAQIAVSVGAASVVPEKPRVVVQIYKENYSWELIRSAGALALNFLRPDQLQLIKTFGLTSGLTEDKMSGVAHRIGPTGSPILEDCWGYLECRVINAMDGGDMTCFLGEVVDGETVSEDGPLWWPQARRVIPAEWNREWDTRINEQIQKSRQRMDQIDYTPWNPTE
ncbi:MAG TPA: flavin reductase family protein [Dehalococcoidia bacterium]|nr:flavin reductase family protein [Dehalococcoidia bacterium]